MTSPHEYRSLSLLVGGAFFMEQLDATIIAPAIPLIALSLNTEPLSLNLTLTAYLLALVVMIPVSGALADRYGTRRVFRTSIALFTLSSVLCALASDLNTLVLARALQGASGAMMVPVGRIAIVRTVERSRLVTSLAMMVTLAMVAPIIGPPLGGWIAMTGSWHWIFLINVPIGLIGWWLAARYVPQIKSERADPFDLLGWLLLAICLVCLIYGLEISRHAHESGLRIAGVFCVGLMSGAAYVIHSRRQSMPLLDFSLLRVKSFKASFIGSALVRVGYGALPFLLPLGLQIGLGFSPSESGFALLGSAVVVIIMKAWTATILRHFGFRSVLIWNGVFCALGLALCAIFDTRWSLLSVFCVLMVGGVARSVQFNALAAIAYADLSPRQTAAATSLNTTFQQLAVTLGISLSAWMLEWFASSSGHTVLHSEDFARTFLVLAVITMMAVPCYLSLDKQAGAELSGHKRA